MLRRNAADRVARPRMPAQGAVLPTLRELAERGGASGGTVCPDCGGICVVHIQRLPSGGVVRRATCAKCGLKGSVWPDARLR